MFAIDHAATALLVKRKYPSASMVWLLLSVQLMELLWVAFNYLGWEKTTTEQTVKSVSDIHLAYMPYSHSIDSFRSRARPAGVADRRQVPAKASARIGGLHWDRVAPNPRPDYPRAGHCDCSRHQPTEVWSRPLWLRSAAGIFPGDRLWRLLLAGLQGWKSSTGRHCALQSCQSATTFQCGARPEGAACRATPPHCHRDSGPDRPDAHAGRSFQP